MRFAKQPVFSLAVALLVFVPGLSGFAQTLSRVPRPSEAMKEQADRLWEIAIQAKGGRERLRGIHDVVISGRAVNELPWLKQAVSRDETLYVFPDKYWSWDDWGDWTHLRVYMYDGSPGGYWFHERDMPRAEKTEDGQTPRFYLLRDQLVYLMETVWVKPIPVEVKDGRVRKEEVDILTTLVERFVVDFYLDKKTHLPVQVTVSDPAVNLPGHLFSESLADYKDFGGLKLPRRVGASEVTYQINADYDDKIFQQLPSVERGPSAWRRQADTQSPKP